MYLLDTNIVIFLFKGNAAITNRIEEVGLENCFISEITVAELIYGAEKSKKAAYHYKLIEEFVTDVRVLPIYDVLKTYAKEKVRLESVGARIDDFDLLIAATAKHNHLTLVTNNTRHFNRIQHVVIEDWVQV